MTDLEAIEERVSDAEVGRLKSHLEDARMEGAASGEDVATLDTLLTELKRLRGALEDQKHFLYQIVNETLGPLFGAANYKHRSEELYAALRNALSQENES